MRVVQFQRNKKKKPPIVCDIIIYRNSVTAGHNTPHEKRAAASRAVFRRNPCAHNTRNGTGLNNTHPPPPTPLVLLCCRVDNNIISLAHSLEKKNLGCDSHSPLSLFHTQLGSIQFLFLFFCFLCDRTKYYQTRTLSGLRPALAIHTQSSGRGPLNPACIRRATRFIHFIVFGVYSIVSNNNNNNSSPVGDKNMGNVTKVNRILMGGRNRYIKNYTSFWQVGLFLSHKILLPARDEHI